MERNKHLHNSVRMMKLTFFALCIFAFKINENLADVMLPPTVCKQGKVCSEYGHDYEGCTEIQENHGDCLNRPDDRQQTCFCPYIPPERTEFAICNHGQQCEKYVI